MKILLVDDEPIQLRGLCKYVHWDKFGCEKPDCVTSAKEAMLYMEKAYYDVVITDVTMPEMSGLQLIELARKQLKKVPCFVILSGYDEFKYAQEAIKLGVRFYVLKPVKVEEIEDVLCTIWIESNNTFVGTSDKQEPISTEKVHPVIFQVIQFIDREYASNINIQILSEQFAINGSYLSSLFKKEMNMNFGTYLTKVRMRKAVGLLKEGNYRVAEIAEKVGYQTASYFSEQFRKEFGCNPKDYKF